MGTADSAQHNYRNIWAVKVRGSLQDAKQLSFKHGFVYEKHVSTVLPFFNLVKFKLYLLRTLQKLKNHKNLKHLHSKNCVALENNIYARPTSTVITSMVYDYGGKFLSRWRSRKQIF